MLNHETNLERFSSRQEACEMMRDRLSEYATLAALGLRPEATFPEVAAHLAGCHSCCERLEELQELTDASYADAVDVAPCYPRPDLSFLGQDGVTTAAGNRAGRIDQLGRILITFSQRMHDTLRPAPLLAASRGELLYRYVEQASPGHDVNVTIEVEIENRARSEARVWAGVDVLSADSFDQAGTSVVLRFGGTSMECATDETGSVDFAPVPLDAVAGLEVEIRPRRLDGQ